MDPTQLQLFRRITLEYFAKLAPAEPPQLEEPYLEFGTAAFLDHGSLVRISGHYEGCLYLTASEKVLRELLALHGEAEVSERTLADVSREVSNVLSGNASRAFGGDWQISVPQSLDPEGFGALDLPPSTFVMPVSWRGSRFLLVIGLTPREGGARWA